MFKGSKHLGDWLHNIGNKLNCIDLESGLKVKFALCALYHSL